MPRGVREAVHFSQSDAYVGNLLRWFWYQQFVPSGGSFSTTCGEKWCYVGTGSEW